MIASIITIGSELLIGQVLDTNAHWIAQKLHERGIEVIEKRSIPDTLDAIVRTLEELSSYSDLILLTGGLGPTKDDITKSAISKYLQVEMHYNDEIYQLIERAFKKRNIPITPSHKEQCFFPDTVQLLVNKLGTAPGMLFKKEGLSIVSMPGVPYEMKYIFEHGVAEYLDQYAPSVIHFSRTIHTIGTGETVIEREIADLVAHLPEGFSIAYLPSIAQVRVRVSGKGTDKNELVKTVNHHADQISQRIEKYVFGYDGIKIQEAIQHKMIDSKATLSIAESCTGGYLSHQITHIPGSSKYYMGSIIAYSNDAKMQQLGVKVDTLNNHGAVSEQVVKEMAIAIRKIMNTTYGIAISGIAGPSGGTEEKKVGTIWIACTDGSQTKTRLLNLSKDRIVNIKYSSVAALNLLRILMGS